MLPTGDVDVTRVHVMQKGMTQWLEGLGLGQYSRVFSEHDIDFEVLPELNEADLQKLDISLGHRKKLLKAISELSLAPPSANTLTKASAAANPERRQLTVMFCDLVGSTALSTRFDPEDMRDLIREYQSLVVHEVSRFDGHVANFMGDGIMSFFGWPVAHEDSGERAVRASMEIMKKIEGLTTPLGETLAARVGIATGLVVVGSLIDEGVLQEEAVIGETPNLAARLQGLAQPGQIIIAGHTRNLLGDTFELEELAPQSVKGIARPVVAHAVKGEKALETRFEARARRQLSPMIGRDPQLSRMIDLWGQVKESAGHGLLVVGEAGIGKSRLTRALTDALADENHTLIRLQCSPHHSDSALWPVIRLLSQEAGFKSDDSAEDKLDKIEALLSQGQDDITASAQIIADLFEIDFSSRYPPLELTPLAKRGRTLSVLGDQLLGLAERQPVIIVLEDAHWIDPTTKELIENCLTRIEDARVLLLITSRPDVEPDFTSHPWVARIALEPLSRAEILAFVSHITEHRELPLPAIDAILFRSDGIPLFIEEMTHMLLRRADDYSKSLERDAAHIPSSIQDMLLMRLDQLGAAKGLAQQAACFGRFFSSNQLLLTANMPAGALTLKLQQLTESGLVDEVDAEKGQYSFKHALVQEAAYASLLRSKRIDLHRTIAQVLEDEDSVYEPEVLAHHFSKGRMFKKSVEYWEAAGQEAMRASAFVEACANFSRALEQLQQTRASAERDERELMLLLSLGDPLISTRGFAAPEVSDAFGRAHEICQGLETVELQFPVLWGLASFHIVRSELDKAYELTNQFLEFARNTGTDDLVLTGNYLVAATHFWRGDFEAVHEPIRNFIDQADPETDVAFQIAPSESPMIDSLSYLAWTLWLMGDPDQGEAYSRQCVELGRSLNSFHDLAYALGFAAWCCQYRHEFERVNELTSELIALATEQEFPYWLSAAKILKGGGLVRDGEFAQGMAEIDEGFEIWNTTGSRLFKPSFLQVKAEALMADKQFDASMECLDEALAEVSITGERLNESELCRLKGELFAQGGQATEAEHWYNKALEISRRQKAKFFELRAMVGLAQLWEQQGKGVAAIESLSAVLAGFDDDLITPDLQEARDMLDELARR